MEITYYWLNSFVIKSQKKKIIIDPGSDMMRRPLIPKKEWDEVDLILVTHGDYDHFGYVTRMARFSSAPVVCGQELEGHFSARGIKSLVVIPGEEVRYKNIKIRGVPTRHGPFPVDLMKNVSHLFRRYAPIGRGEIGFLLEIEKKRICNLGDSLFLEEWKKINCDILMVPIGGFSVMGPRQALQAIDLIKPKTVIPCHYNYGLFFFRPLDIDRKRFLKKVEEMGYECLMLKEGETISLE